MTHAGRLRQCAPHRMHRTGGAGRFADPRQVRELALGALAPGRHVRLELAREAFLPVGGLAAVAVGVDHEGAELTLGASSETDPSACRPTATTSARSRSRSAARASAARAARARPAALPRRRGCPSGETLTGGSYRLAPTR